ncbi:MAG: hypothetical protein ACT4NY_06370 [Pseudonocardiales bacterium]
MVIAVLAVATAASYLAWGAWNSYRYVDPRATHEGPFEPWQASGVVLYLALGLIAGVAGWRRCGWAAILVIPATMIICISIIGLSDTYGGPLSVIGAIFIAFSTFFWVAPIAVLAEAISRRKAR